MSPKGYSLRLVQANQAADLEHIGVRLGRYCIAKDIPVMEIAKKFSVSRMAVYQWFVGASVPHKARVEKIERYLDKANSSK